MLASLILSTSSGPERGPSFANSELGLEEGEENGNSRFKLASLA